MDDLLTEYLELCYYYALLDVAFKDRDLSGEDVTMDFPLLFDTLTDSPIPWLMGRDPYNVMEESEVRKLVEGSGVEYIRRHIPDVREFVGDRSQ